MTRLFARAWRFGDQGLYGVGSTAQEFQK